MLNQVIAKIIKQQRPYYFLQGNTIKGIDNQYWLIFKHRDADNLLNNIVSFLGLVGNHHNYKLIRIDLNTAHLFYYAPKNEKNLPNNTLLRTSKVEVIEKFLEIETVEREDILLAGSFRELETKIKRRRKFNLPEDKDKYHNFITAYLERTKIYRRSTAFFNSGVLKLYEEPLQKIVVNQGEIRLLMDWMGFTNTRDVVELKKLQNPDYCLPFIRRTLSEFLANLDDRSLTSTEILAELVRLNILKIKMVKMETERRAIYHKKTGILTDHLGNHIMHEGSDNFTKAAHTKNAESITFLYYSQDIDLEAIEDTIKQFDTEWENSQYILDISLEFLNQIITEKDKRIQKKKPVIDSINPHQLTAGESSQVIVTGNNLADIEVVSFPDNELISITIETQSQTQLITTFTVSPEHPAILLSTIILQTTDREFNLELRQPLEIIQKLVIPDFPEIEGFRDALELILTGRHGQPHDFLFWLAQQKPHLLRVETSDLLVELVNQGVLYEHQKSGAQHCYRIMQDFGVAVCADAVGLGKTRLAAAVTKLYQHDHRGAKIAIIAAKKLHSNWEREMSELGFEKGDYELYNKNLMSRRQSNFRDDFNRYGGADLVLIDEAHEGIRNYNNRIHRTCLEIREQDLINKRQRHYLLLTATPWNNRREDIYNILAPFITRPEGFRELGFPGELVDWFGNRDIGVESFTDNTPIFRRTYRELCLQRTRKMLILATPDLNLYAKRIAEWLPVNFEPETEKALDRIFTQFESSLFIPFADPIRYLTDTVEQRALLRNQRRMFLQRAESSMYALGRTINNFSVRIKQLQTRLASVTPDIEGLKQFLLLHYQFLNEGVNQPYWDDEEEIEDEEEEEDSNLGKEEKRQQLRNRIESATASLQPEKAKSIYEKISADCDSDLQLLGEIERLLAGEFIKDHKRERVTQQVRELVTAGHKVLLISTFSDTVIDYYRYMVQDSTIKNQGIGMAIGSNKKYYQNQQIITINKHSLAKGALQQQGLARVELFKLFAPYANCRQEGEKPTPEAEISILIGSETLSVGQNLQDADYLINIDLPWNPMILEQRIGRIDRPKQHRCEHIFIYYANSQSQLLRQASRLDNLNKKLVGDLVQKDNLVPKITNIEELGASVYGDTVFDDEILPGYIEFIRSLVTARKLQQNNLQEETYQKQEKALDLYTENEIFQSDELKKLVQQLGEDYLPNSITLGSKQERESPSHLVALTIDYFGPNHEPIPEQRQIIYWNDVTQEEDGYGKAIATGFQTPEYHDIVSAPLILKRAEQIYQQLLKIKQQYEQNIEKEETPENINITSERVSRIQKKIRRLNKLPDDLNQESVRESLNKLNQHKHNKKVQKLLKYLTDGAGNNLTDNEFISELVQQTNILSLLNSDETKPTKLRMYLAALLLLI